MKDIKTARVMILMAEKDFCALSSMGNSSNFPDEIFGFHVQQAVEKGLKAWLCCLGVAYPRKHDLSELAKMLSHGACRRMGTTSP
ncbi:MAG: HEPN domain-containing protein [Magnetococcales bacterium]|nr:HEPN domain-containing protein [Magnetococcales bacterium]